MYLWHLSLFVCFPLIYCLMGRKLLYNVVLVSALQQISHISYLPLEPPFYMHLIVQ